MAKAKAVGKAGTAEKCDRLNALWLALGYLGSKRGDRKQLSAGDVFPMKLSIVGKFGRSSVAEDIQGSLEMGEATQASSSSAAPADRIAALLLRELGDDNAQAAVMAKIANAFQENGYLPGVSEAEQARAEMWLKRLRSSVTTTKSGSLVFVVNGE